jgi:GT2 family glycosyltransferase
VTTASPPWACVLLTRGDRPDDLDAAIASLARQTRPPDDVVVVVNGGTVPEPLPAPARIVALPQNVGVPAGRNRGVQVARGDWLLFLDDDAELATSDLTDRTAAAFAADPSLSVISYRIADPDTGQTQRRHVPRLRVGDPGVSSAVTTFLGGACAIRRATFESAGGLPDAFFFAMEETDLAWRILDGGGRIVYRGDLVVHHPATSPSRHPDAVELTARNRVWLARRRLPVLLAVAYVASWVVVTLARARASAERRAALRGFLRGLREPAGERRPMRWATAWRMARIGRPPVI